MLTTYTLEEMMQLWRRRYGLLVDDCGCVVTRHDGTSVDALLHERIDSWYDSLLLTADPALLPVRDMADEVEKIERVSENCISLEFPEKGVRPLLVQLTYWDDPLTVFHTADSATALRQRNPRLGGTRRHPVGVVVGRNLFIYGVSDGEREVAITPDFSKIRLKKLLMVAYPKDTDIYTLDRSLLSTIKPSDYEVR